MSAPDQRIREALVAFLDFDAQVDLDRACAIAASEPVDIATLLDWVQGYRCEERNRAQAMRSLRAALRLSVVPGAPCRPAR